MADTSSFYLTKYVEELTKCPICLEDVTKPRILPCFHTYCLECMRKYSNDKSSGDVIGCPVCRKEFVIPVEGVDQLPHNFFIDGLIEAKKLSAEGAHFTVLCDVCSDYVPTVETQTAATMFCTHCQQKLCRNCSKVHSRIPGGKHKVVQYGSEELVTNLKLKSSYCKEHEGQKNTLYCLKCEKNMCIVCKVSKHENHKSQTISEIYPILSKTIRKDLVNVYKQKELLSQQAQIMREKEDEHHRMMSSIEIGVQKVGNEIALIVDNAVREVIAELGEHANQTNKNTEDLRNCLDMSLEARNSFTRFAEEVLSKGNSYDITDAYKGLHARAKELLEENEQTTIADDYKLPTTSSMSDDVYSKVYEHVRVRSSAHKKWMENEKKNLAAAVDVAVKNLREELEIASEKNYELKTKLAKRDHEIDKILNEKSKLMSEIRQLKLHLAGDNQTEKEMLKQEIARRQQEIARLQRTIDKTTREVGGLKASVTRLDQQVLVKQIDIDNLKKTIAEMKRVVASQQTAIEKFKKEATVSETQISKLNLQVAVHQSDNEKLRKDIHDKQLEDSGCRRQLRDDSTSQISVRLFHSFPEDKPVYGVTTLDNEVYVHFRGQPDIAVYDNETFTLQRRLSIEGLGVVLDMASCRRYQCLYIADKAYKVIHRVPRANSQTTNWDVGDQSFSLSVNSECHVLVTLWKVHRVAVFTTHGELVKEINLQQTDIESPQHTVQLSTVFYAVSHSGSLHKVVAVNDGGRVQHSFGKDKGSNEDQLNVPSRLAVVKSGYIFVADANNKRLVVLQTPLRYVNCFNLSGKPFRMWFDDDTDRLYVGVNKWSAEHKVFTSGIVEVYRVSFHVTS